MAGRGRVPTGWAEETVISDASFRLAHQSVISSTNKKRKREEAGAPKPRRSPWDKFEDERTPEASSDEEGVEVIYEEDEIEEQPTAPATKAGTAYEETGDGHETTAFYGESIHDYQGRSFLHIPSELRGEVAHTQNYVPKKLVHTWKDHTKAISQLRFFPESGHLLLSASADSTVKLYDVQSRELLRGYMGHSKSVNDICFNNDGTRFLTSSYDRQMKLWDTETGACLSRFSTGKTAHVLRFNPDPSLNHEFLAGMSDKKIVQFDTRTGAQVQEYDHHLGPVNTITFCDENRRFMTTSDDKSLRAWEYGIPVPIKLVSDPSMFSMVRSSPHPSKPFVAYQSADNQVLIYGSSDRFRQNRKKSFRGHNTAGYAIDVAISPMGNIVSSGDSGGYVCFWDWKTTKMWHKIQASDAAVLACQWHPREKSKLVTGDLNGVIKYWD
ncbi:WD40 repeat-like protein [Eremomyces bilateralis CBS 781.70]|uniref:WD40 repeat-like protein n=1 Tax=Eremomyces bilateralis CBS 781.70 TaxID=1392243 RepID=A0A6G1G816_9PEZI|nr:WD40 repeat-like protein [Eremomyces bilateralis CBS 781.70]KAF1814173.1 WD40 repeat-like protein [Eremomyces bilateralis CBS 781.70]